MATSPTPQRILRELAGADPRQAGLTVLGAEAMIEFQRAALFMNHVMIMDAEEATSEQFPVFGRADVGIHTPGVELLGEEIANATIEIDLEDFITFSMFFPDIDRQLTTRRGRETYARNIGSHFRNYREKDISRAITQCAESAATIPGAEGHGSGKVETNAAFANDGLVIYQGIFDLVTEMELDDVPTEDLLCALDPVRYALLVQSEKPINADITANNNGGVDTGSVNLVNDVPVRKTNSVAREDDSANTKIHSDRRQDYSTVMGQVWHRDAIGVLQGVDITFEDERQARKVGDLLVARMLYGIGGLRPECCGVLKSA